MAAPRLSEIGKIIVKKNPWGGGNAYYFARRSFPPGATPAHLVSYTEKFTAAARSCKAAITGLPKGREKVEALRGCIGNAMRR